MDEQNRALETEIQNLQGDLKIQKERQKTTEEERDHFKSELDERTKERDE